MGESAHATVPLFVMSSPIGAIECETAYRAAPVVSIFRRR